MWLLLKVRGDKVNLRRSKGKAVLNKSLLVALSEHCIASSELHSLPGVGKDGFCLGRRLRRPGHIPTSLRQSGPGRNESLGDSGGAASS
jgi:hypothetical protein